MEGEGGREGEGGSGGAADEECVWVSRERRRRGKEGGRERRRVGVKEK